MGLFSKLAESISTGSSSLLSITGVLKSFNEENGNGIILAGGKQYEIKANKTAKYGIFETFPYGVPEIGSLVLFNVETMNGKAHAISVVQESPRRRIINYLEELKKLKENNV